MARVRITLGGCYYPSSLTGIIAEYMAGNESRWAETLGSKKAVVVKDLDDRQAQRLAERIKDRQGNADILPDPVTEREPITLFGVVIKPGCVILPTELAEIVGRDSGDVNALLRLSNGQGKRAAKKPKPVFILSGVLEERARAAANAIKARGGKAEVREIITA